MSEQPGDLVAQLRRRVADLEEQICRRRNIVDEGSEFLLRAFEDAPIGMALVGMDERIFEANPALCRMLGYSREELLEKTVPEITHPEDRTIEAQPKGNLKAGTSGWFVVEKRYLRADGNVLMGRLSVTMLTDENGDPSYFIGQLEDVTRERQAERTLRNREATLRALVESSADIFCVVDAAGMLRFRSPQLRELLGDSLDELGTRRFVEWVHEEDRAGFEQAIAEVMSRPDEILRCSLRMRRADGSLRSFEAVGRHREAVLGGVVLSLRDVTERQALQAQLAQAQRLDSLGRLVGGVAHDFNNMLGVILALTEFVGESIDKDDPSRGDLNLIEATILRALDLTKQLLAVGRRQHGASETIELHEAIESNRVLLQKLLGEDIQLEIFLEASTCSVRLDATHAQQILINFASNARDAIAGSGRFSLKTRNLHIAEEGGALPVGDYVELAAQDSGHGMSAEARERAFEPFFTTKEVGRGTGLGLATVHGIVVQAGGSIHIDSEPGQGSCMVVRLPLHRAVRRPSGSQLRAAVGNGEQILLVEDDAALRSTTQRILKRGGYRVIVAGHPDEAIQIVQNGEPIDLVVTDVVMPKKSGPELYQAICEIRGELPIVYLSGYARAAHSEVGEHPGFLPKPFSSKALLAKVRSVLARHRRAARRGQ